MSSGWSRAPRSAPPARAISSRCASRWPRSRAFACCSSEFQAPLVRSLAAELDDLPDLRSELERTLLDEPPALRARRRRRPRRRRSGARRSARHQPIRASSASPRWRTPSVRAPASRRSRSASTACSATTSRSRGRTWRACRRTTTASRRSPAASGSSTPALKAYEEKVLGADERILERELELFEALRQRVAAEAPRIQDTARGLASLRRARARWPKRRRFRTTPSRMMHAGDELVATDARHAVVERHAADAFVPNDVMLDGAAHQLVILTGPNMGGKSTYLRQTALLCLMAQAGSFVPARTAKLPVVDRLFARVGASDNIARGQSTFMVEMQETANILHSATSRSLVILDEIGRGTSTFDGLSLAWAVAEHLASNTPRTAEDDFRHALSRAHRPGRRTPLASSNFHVVVREWKEDIVFLRKVVPGRSDRSYGIQVARLAGLPPPSSTRAREILNGLERDELSRGGRPSLSGDGHRPADAARLVPGARGRGRSRAPPPARAGRQRHHADAGAGTARGTEGRGRRSDAGVPGGARLLAASLALVLAACRQPPPRPGTGSSSRWPTRPSISIRVSARMPRHRRLHQLLFIPWSASTNSCVSVPDLAESLDQPDRAHATSRTCVKACCFTTAASSRRTTWFIPSGAFSIPPSAAGQARIASARQRHGTRSVHRRVQAEGSARRSFPINLVMGIVQAGLGRGERTGADRHRPVPAGRVHAGRSRRPRGFAGLLRRARRAIAACVLKVIPDDTMRGLELRKGTVDLIVNDLSPDIVWQLRHEGRMQVATSAGTDYAYVGMNLQDPDPQSPRGTQGHRLRDRS